MLTTLQENELLDNLEQAVTWLSGMTRVSAHSRWHTYLKDIAGIANARATGTNFVKNRSNFDLNNSIYEAQQLVDVFKAFQSYEGPGLSDKLALIAHGPENYVSEKNDGGSSRARNTTFELYLASLFALAGCKVVFSVEQSASDIRLVFDEYDIFIECKRPVSLTNLEKTTKSAFEQTMDRVSKSKDKKAYGVVAFSIDKLFNRDFHFIQTKGEVGISTGLAKKINEFSTTQLDLWHKRKCSSDIAVMVQFSCVAYMDEPSMVSFSRLTNIYEFVRRSPIYKVPPVLALNHLYEAINPDNRRDILGW